MTKPGRHYSCTRCGYRGTNADHECRPTDLERHSTTPTTIPISPRALRAARLAEAKLEEPDAERVVGEFARLLGRTVTVASEPAGLYGSVSVLQRCRVCRTEIRATVSGFKSHAELTERLANSIGHAYYMHECPPVEQQLHGFSIDELGELHQQLERDSVRLADRVVEIERYMGRRSS